MNKNFIKITLLFSLLYSAAFFSQASERETLLHQYASQNLKQTSGQNTQQFSEARGQMLWQQALEGDAPFIQRSCTSCHGEDLKNEGKHIRTNKAIKALAPSVNSSSLTDAKKIEKWFKRNCKWTLGRECSPQEKGDILTYIQNQ
mgnify:FL=1|tara:strand:+ start:796 stop:1230 length:435 start_codon:yes stop_codon:yes gene_type:complete